MEQGLIDSYYDSGKELSQSPFLASTSRDWGHHLSLKVAALSACCLLLSFLLSAPLFLLFTFFLAGVPALIGAIEDLMQGCLNLDVLMSLAAFISLLIGRGHEGGLLLVLFAFAGALEKSVTSKARGTLRSLEALTAGRAFVLRAEGPCIERSVADIAVGETILVKAGGMVPLDGCVIAGSSSLNLVHLTGESLPVSVREGDAVPAGAHNREGTLTLRVTREGAESTIARIIRLITEAQKARPKIALWLERMMDRYASGVLIVTFAYAILLPLVTSIPYLGMAGSIYRALAFMIAASPCALILAVPIAYLSAISACAKRGVLLKGGVVLDRLANCDKIAFDKTGTLTTGELRCMSTVGETRELLALALALEQRADHPIARAICRYVEEQSILPVEISDFSALFGKGVRALYRGSEAMISSCATHRVEGTLSVSLSYREKSMLFILEDTLRPQAEASIKQLHAMGLTTIILSGDRQESVEAVGHLLQINCCVGCLTPQAKLERVNAEEHLIMVGDGINDAPALARATVGIAMGKMGNAVAADVADVVLLQDHIDQLGWLIAKARKTRCIVKQNLTLAGLVICAAMLPALLGWIPLWLAVVLHEGGTVLVGLNALRLLLPPITKNVMKQECP